MAADKFLIKFEKQKYNTPAISKQSAKVTAAKIYMDIMEGRATAIDIAEMMKFIGDVESSLKEMRDENDANSFTELVRGEITNNSNDGKSCMSKYSSKLELFEAGTKYDYSVCNDKEWNGYQAELEALKEKMKDREKFLKAIKKTTPVVDPENGEVNEIYPCAKTSTSTFKLSLVEG